jgi:thioredoxin-related protein
MRSFIFAFSMLLSATFVHAQGIDFFHGTFEEALKLANEEDKAIFVDAYTTWCGPCKRMSKLVFPDERVGTFYNANFISLKLDMEKEDGLNFRRTYPVSAYPTFYYIKPDGEVLLTTKGARQIPDFIALGESALKGFDSSAKYKISYESGNRDYNSVLDYVKALNRSGKPSNKVVNEYLKTQTDLDTEENLVFIFEGASRVDTRAFSYLEEKKGRIKKLVGPDRLNERIQDAAWETVTMASEYQSPELLLEAQNAMENHLPKFHDSFTWRSNMVFAVAVLDDELYLKNAKPYVKKMDPVDAEELHSIANEIMKYFNKSKAHMELAEKAAARAFKEDAKTSYVYTYASIVFMNGAREEALELVNEALEREKEKKQQPHQLLKLKKIFENS